MKTLSIIFLLILISSAYAHNVDYIFLGHSSMKTESITSSLYNSRVHVKKILSRYKCKDISIDHQIIEKNYIKPSEYSYRVRASCPESIGEIQIHFKLSLLRPWVGGKDVIELTIYDSDYNKLRTHTHHYEKR